MGLARLSIPFSLVLSIALLLSGEANSQNIVERWNSVEVPRAPELRPAVIDAETTALLVMGFVEQSCNMERRPRCVETIPAVRRLLDNARAHGVFIMYSVPTNDPAGE